MKKILIIGIDSFTGMHFSNFMKNFNYDVYGTTQKEKNISKFYKCNIQNKHQVKCIISDIKPDFIVNLAAISFVATEKKDLFYQVNVLAVENILESILEIPNYKPSKIILVSSATVYGNQSYDILNEDMIPNPINHYGISKLAMEQIAKTYFNNLNIIITRPFNYTGIGQNNNFLIPKIVSHYQNHKQEIELGNVNVYREFNDVEFICESYKRLLEIDKYSEIVNIASNRLISLNDVISKMNKIANYNIKININQNFIRRNEIIKLSGSPNKLFGLVGEIHQKDFLKTLTDMYKNIE